MNNHVFSRSTVSATIDALTRVKEVRQGVLPLEDLGVVSYNPDTNTYGKKASSRKALTEQVYDLLILQNQYHALVEQMQVLQDKSSFQWESLAGSTMEHKRFGTGHITSADSNGRLTVDFDLPFGTKLLDGMTCIKNSLAIFQVEDIPNIIQQLYELYPQKLVLIFEIEKLGKEILAQLQGDFEDNLPKAKAAEQAAEEKVAKATTPEEQEKAAKEKVVTAKATQRLIERFYQNIVKAMAIYKMRRSNKISMDTALTLLAASEYRLVKLLESRCSKKVLAELIGKCEAAHASALIGRENNGKNVKAKLPA